VRCDGSHRNGLFATRHLVATLSGPMVLRTHKSRGRGTNRIYVTKVTRGLLALRDNTA
jgi:hypothetical protein